jgi:hypothetical protein
MPPGQSRAAALLPYRLTGPQIIDNGDDLQPVLRKRGNGGDEIKLEEETESSWGTGCSC